MRNFLQFISDNDVRRILLSADDDGTITLNSSFNILALTFLREYHYIYDWGNNTGPTVTCLTQSGRMLYDAIVNTQPSPFFTYLHTLQLLNQAYEKAIEEDDQGIIDIPHLMHTWQQQATTILQHILKDTSNADI